MPAPQVFCNILHEFCGAALLVLTFSQRDTDIMKISRRDVLTAAGAIPLSGIAAAAATEPTSPGALPDKRAFEATEFAYLDSGSHHPLSIGARAAAKTYLDSRAFAPAESEYRLDTQGVIEKYARLVNADVDEITFVQSTTTGEQMFLRALGLPESGGHIVTDPLHFFGSLPLYEEMARQGVEVTWVRDRDGRIPLEDMRRAIRPGTKLVSLSLVSTINGFEHDLKVVCDIAHDAGALVYADIIHAAGCVPLDLHATGVDFAAGASYKWLMGDFGLGFLYARKDVQSQLKRTNYGYYGMSRFESHIYPYDTPGETIADYGFQDNAAGHFALGTRAHSVIAILDHSLDYLLATGVDTINAHARTLTDRLKGELADRGFELMTPMESRAPMVACAFEDAREKLRSPLQNAGVRMTVSRHRFRASVSVFNDMQDIDRLLDALDRAG